MGTFPGVLVFPMRHWRLFIDSDLLPAFGELPQGEGAYDRNHRTDSEWFMRSVIIFESLVRYGGLSQLRYSGLASHRHASFESISRFRGS